MVSTPVSRSADRKRFLWPLLILLGIVGTRVVLGADNRPPSVAAELMTGGAETRIPVMAREADCKPVGRYMLIIGYDDERQEILIQNSEGPGWGGTLDGTPPNGEDTNGGHVWMAYSTFSALAQGTAFYHQE